MRHIIGIEKRQEGDRLRAFTQIQCDGCQTIIVERKRTKIEKLLQAPCSVCRNRATQAKKQERLAKERLKREATKAKKAQLKAEKESDSIIECGSCSSPFVVPAGTPGRKPTICPTCKVRSDKEGMWEYNLIKTYGVNKAWYDAKLKEQGGTCYICPKTPEDNRNGKLFVDHNHKTGEVRGLLCLDCNHGLGKFFDNISYLERSIMYLREHSE